MSIVMGGPITRWPFPQVPYKWRARLPPIPPFPPPPVRVQVEDPSNPHGLEHGWRWLSRAVNALPGDWLSAKALSCFLRTAGYSMFKRWGRNLCKGEADRVGRVRGRGCQCARVKSPAGNRGQGFWARLQPCPLHPFPPHPLL